MTIYDGIQRIQDYNTLNLNASLRWINHAYTGEVLTVRRDFDDEETDVFMNQTTGFIDDDSLCDGSASSPGSQTIATWKDAAGASDLYITRIWDTSGKGNHPVQTNPLFQPRLDLNGSGNRAAPVYGWGVDRVRLQADITDYSGESTIFLVYKSTQRQLETAASFASGDGQNINTFQFRWLDDNFAMMFQGVDSIGVSGAGARAKIEPSEQIGSIALATVTIDTADTVKTYFNGTFNAQKTMANGFTGLYEVYKIGLASNSIDFFVGEIYEVVVINQLLSDTERESIESGIINSYGIS